MPDLLLKGGRAPGYSAAELGLDCLLPIHLSTPLSLAIARHLKTTGDRRSWPAPTALGSTLAVIAYM
jgi:hypothetical protein